MTRAALACYLAAAALLFKRFVFSEAGLRPEDWDANIAAHERRLKLINKLLASLHRAQRSAHRHWRESLLRKLHACRERIEAELRALIVERAMCAAEMEGAA